MADKSIFPPPGKDLIIILVIVLFYGKWNIPKCTMLESVV